MAGNSFEYDLLVDSRQAMGELAKFTKAQEETVKRIKKAQEAQVESNVKVDRSIIKTRTSLSKARAELVRYSKNTEKHGDKAEDAARDVNKLTHALNKQQQELREGKRSLTEYAKQLDKLQRNAAKGIDVQVRSPNHIPAPPRMLGPGFAGAGQTGLRGRLNRGVANASARASGAFSALGGAAGSGGLLAPLASGFAVQRSVSGALDLDSQRQKLKLLSAQYGEYNQILKIIDSSAETFNKSQREATREFANVFARLRPLGVELHQIKGVYEGFNTVAIASGATSESSRIAFMQLAQAIGSGRLAGDEFRSISEQIPGVLLPISKVMKVNVGDLKELGAEGKITSDVLIHALSHGINISKEEIKAFLAEQPAQKFKAFSNSVSDLGVAVGEALLPVLVPLVEKLTELVKGFLDLPTPIRTVVIVLGTAFLGVTALAAAFKTLGLASGAKFVGNLLATMGGITATGNASSVAAGKVGLLAAQLKGLAMLGIITVGVNYIMMGMKQGAALEDEIAKFEAGGPGSTFAGASRETVQRAQKTAKATKEQIQTELDKLKPPGWMLAIPGVGAAMAAQAGSRAQQLQYRNLNADTVLGLNPNDYATDADMAAARAKKMAEAFAKAGGSGSGRDIAGQLAKTEANNALRLTQKNAQIALKVAREEYALRSELEQTNHKLQEQNLVGIAREQQAILNARIQAIRELEVRDQRLQDEVTKAEQRLNAAEQRLNQASGPVDALRAQGLVSQAQGELSGANTNLDNFRSAAPTMVGNISKGVSAKSTEALRQQTQQTLIQVGALRKRNELLAQGVSPEILEGEMAKFEIDRSTAIQLQRLNVDRVANATAIRDVKLAAEEAKGAIDQLTEAQQNGTNKIRDYINTSMDFVTDIQGRMLDIAATIEQGIGTAIQGVVSGTLTASQAFGQFFASVGKSFLAMASQMIAKLIMIKILKTAIGFFGNSGGGESAADISTGSGLPTAQATAIAGGGSVEWSSDMSTLGGNIVSAPSPFEFAKGGIVTGPTNALIGEGGMNEAIVPLPNGRSIPVQMAGGGAAGNIQTNITVNVDQGGQTDSQTSGDNANKLGKAIDSAVKRVIMDERRVGGLLYNGRR